MSSGSFPNNSSWSEQSAHPSPDHNDFNSKRHNTKLLQVLRNFFGKAAQVVVFSRSSLSSLDPPESWSLRQTDADASNPKVNKWFNLHVHSTKRAPKYDLRLWKSCPDLGSMPPMIIETYLDMRLLPGEHAVTLHDEHGRTWAIPKLGTKKHEIVLERWLFEFDAAEATHGGSDDLPLLYKKSIILFRALLMFAQLMPAFRLQEAISRDERLPQLRIANKVLDGSQPIRSRGRVGLSKPILAHRPTQPHMVQKHFLPIQTSSGTLKVSVAYRTQTDFSMDEATQYPSECVDIPKSHVDVEKVSLSPADIERNLAANTKPVAPRSNHVAVPLDHAPGHANMSASPSARPKADYFDVPSHAARPGILPFRSGAQSSSPPTLGVAGAGNKTDRRISITSNRSTSNASLVALLRKSRNSFVASNSPANIPITISTSNNLVNAHSALPIPRSVPSSHGSIVQSDEHLSRTPDSMSGTPRFSSSFGQRMGRRLSAHSMNRSPLAAASIPDSYDKQLISTSVGLGESNMMLSGVYVDEDISAFVRMIDSSSDLKLASLNAKNNRESMLSSIQQSTSETLSRFQSLKSKHQQLGDSVSASINLNRAPSLNTGSGHGVRSKSTSRRSSKSMHSSPSPLQHGSYEQKFMPSIHSKLRDSPTRDASPSPTPTQQSSGMIYPSILPLNLSRLKSSPAYPSVALTTLETQASSKQKEPTRPGVVGLATTPSAYQGIQDRFYEDVFEDDDDDDDEDIDGGNHPNELAPTGFSGRYSNYQIGTPSAAKSTPQATSAGAKNSLGTGYHMDSDDEDLLFTMSDMNLSKH